MDLKENCENSDHNHSFQASRKNIDIGVISTKKIETNSIPNINRKLFSTPNIFLLNIKLTTTIIHIKMEIHKYHSKNLTESYRY